MLFISEQKVKLLPEHGSINKKTQSIFIMLTFEILITMMTYSTPTIHCTPAHSSKLSAKSSRYKSRALVYLFIYFYLTSKKLIEITNHFTRVSWAKTCKYRLVQDELQSDVQ